jgi:hypothetical protein
MESIIVRVFWCSLCVFARADPRREMPIGLI